MSDRDARLLQRLLLGELDDEGAVLLKRRILEEPDLRRAWARLETTWGDLDLPEPSAALSGMAERIAAAATVGVAERVRWSLAPTWAQAGAAGALALGVVLGLGVAASLAETPDPVWDTGVETTLAESYWFLLDEGAQESIDGSATQ